jgi:thiamine-monophosphate kinase
LELALYGGEEYELILTINPSVWIEAEKAVASAGGVLTKIGIVTKEKQILLKTAGKIVSVEPRGWEHFKTE